MAGLPTSARRLVDELDKHRRIFWALLMRELSTRYGRNDLGFRLARVPSDAKQ